MHVDLMFPSNYLKAADLRGQEHVVVIEKIEPQHELQTKDGKETKPIMRFVGKKKALVLNKTNAKLIAGMYGKESDKWIGRAITLHTAEVEAFGDIVDAIRVRRQVPTEESITAALGEPPHDAETGEVTAASPPATQSSPMPLAVDF